VRAVWVGALDSRKIAQPTVELKLYLDSDNSFNPSSPSDDSPSFVPGANPDGSSVDLTDGKKQTVKVIALFRDARTGQTVAPPSGISSVSFHLSETSALMGVAMNSGTDTTPDYQLSAGSAPFVGNTAQVDMWVKDYGGVTRINANAGSYNAAVHVPLDVNQDGIADVGWKVGPGVQVNASAASDDKDDTPTGKAKGDGLTAFEEYRGFIARGQHIRTDPAVHDLFVNSDLSEGYGYASNLCNQPLACLAVHKIEASEFQETGVFGARLINGNNQDTAGLVSVAGHYDQNALLIQEKPYRETVGNRDVSEIVGLTRVCLDSSCTVFGPRAVAYPIEIYTENIRALSPPNKGEQYKLLEDPPDVSKIMQTIAHEIGHALYIKDWCFRDPSKPELRCPAGAEPAFPGGRQPTVMITGYFGDDADWQRIPISYDNDDRKQMRLR
jgi:hypothetical protein